MLRFVISRLVQLVVICFLISVFAFLLVHLLPGNPAKTILGADYTPATYTSLLKQLGLNKNLFEQYTTWITNIFHGNLGESYITKQTVTNALGVAVPIDLELIIVSQVLALIVAIPMALVAALRPNRAFDRVATTSTFGMLALPTFVVGPLLVLVFAVTLKWVPATGFDRLSQGFGPNLKSVILPSVALAIGSITVYYRLLRADLIATLQEDFVTMARSKGLSTRYILLRHVLRPSSFSLLAGAGISILRGRDPLPAPGHRVSVGHLHLWQRLPDGPGHGAGGCRSVRGRELRRRLLPHRLGPAGAPCLSSPPRWRWSPTRTRRRP
jgi:peptide/nickel transport system permease protein